MRKYTIYFHLWLQQRIVQHDRITLVYGCIHISICIGQHHLSACIGAVVSLRLIYQVDHKSHAYAPQ